jgi:transcriptional regulator with XRE-family HTH domain
MTRAEPPSFTEMLADIRQHHTLSEIARGTGYSVSYICDIAQGNRRPTPEFINRICNWLGRAQVGRRTWHLAAARSCGWDV